MKHALDHALKYADRGWQVFSLAPKSKFPLKGSRWKDDATCDVATIRSWFDGSPHNLAVRTGQCSGVFVVDIDGANGASNLAELEARHGALPRTLTTITASGCHLWFRTNGSDIRGGNGKFCPCIDVKAEGCYVVAPPSIHPDGWQYRWSDYSTPPALAPDWLIKLLIERKPISVPQRAISGHTSRYAAAALRNEIDRASSAPPGQRNHQLNRSSFSLHQLVAGGLLNRGDVEAQLISAAQACGLLKDDGLQAVRATIRSGARAGLRHPRAGGR
jgi:putative DNA primase/helicase